MLPRVIVLIAANMEQLECSVEQHFISVYEKSLKHEGSMMSIERCRSFTERYLQKFIPVSHRIHLPDINQAVQRHFSTLRVRYLEGENNLLLDKKACGQVKEGDWNIQQLTW